MKQIATVAPIPMDILKLGFSDNEKVEFVIDYSESKFKGKIFLTYLSNLDIRCRLSLPDPIETLNLVAEYFKTPTLLSLVELENIAINILLGYQGKPNDLSIDCTAFYAEHKEILEVWLKRLKALPLYALYVSKANEEYVKTFPHDSNHSMSGINYVHLIKHPYFILILEGMRQDEMTYNEILFNEYSFAGTNLYKYFHIPENPLNAVVLASSNNEEIGSLSVLDSLLQEDYRQLSAAIAELENVPLI